MLIYHGSEKQIRRPIFGQGNPRNDYGSGFYCTESLELAKETEKFQIPYLDYDVIVGYRANDS